MEMDGWDKIFEIGWDMQCQNVNNNNSAERFLKVIGLDKMNGMG